MIITIIGFIVVYIPNEIYADGGKSIQIQYPSNYTGIQRINENQGDIIIQGVYSGIPTNIEAQFNSGQWEIIDQNPSDGKFSGKLLKQKVSQGDLIVRFTNDNMITDTASPISIGDVFLITGQSNAWGAADNLQKVDSTNEFISTVFYGDTFPKIKNGTNFAEKYNWYDDPYEEYSPFPLVSNDIIQSENIPISFIQTSKPGGEIAFWEKGFGNNYEEIILSVTKATNGTMNIKAILYFQGETNAVEKPTLPLGSYHYYKNTLKKLIQNLSNDLNVEFFILGQTGEVTSDHSIKAINEIRKAQQELWGNDNIVQGPITYDIGPHQDHLHFMTNKEIHELSNRWTISILRNVYGYETPTSPELLDAKLDNSKKKITLVFDKNIKLENWIKVKGKTLKGLYIEDGNTKINYNNFEVELHNNEINIILNQQISNYASISYASGNNSTGEYTIREISDNSLPIKPIFQVILYYDSIKTQNWALPKPNQQIEDGIPLDHITCNDRLIRIFFNNDSVACVTHNTKQKMLERGITMIESQ